MSASKDTDRAVADDRRPLGDEEDSATLRRGLGGDDVLLDDDGGPADQQFSGVGRRALVRAGLAGLGGLAAGGLAPVGMREAAAAPSDPGVGARVTPNPISAPIQKSGLAVEIVDFSRPPRTSSKPAFALLNSLYHINDGSGRIFTNDSNGKVWEINRTTGAATLFLDLLRLRGRTLIKNTRQTGLRSFAFHPDFSRSGTAGFRKFYTTSTESVASRPAGVRVFTGPFTAIFDDVICEWTADAAGRTIVTSTRRELFRIAQYKTDHNTDQLMFDPNARPGSASYGLLFMGTGDGGNSNPGDPFGNAQNTTRALGKVLCINPLRQSSGAPYGVPSTNPFVGRAGFLGEIWAIGFRHPQNLSFDRGGSGTFFITDIGQSNIEEVNIGVRGANYGWAVREGPFATDLANGRILYQRPANDAGRNLAYPALIYDHTDGKAVAGGYVYRGTAVPALVGQYIYGDIVSGRIYHAPVSGLRSGGLAAPQELTLLRNGRPVTMLQLVGTSIPPNRVDLRFGQDEAGEVYVLSKQDGAIRKLRAAGG